jgi:hypothetical protein
MQSVRSKEGRETELNVDLLEGGSEGRKKTAGF